MKHQLHQQIRRRFGVSQGHMSGRGGGGCEAEAALSYQTDLQRERESERVSE